MVVPGKNSKNIAIFAVVFAEIILSKTKKMINALQ
jgi:hypothetical protein